MGRATYKAKASALLLSPVLKLVACQTYNIIGVHATVRHSCIKTVKIGLAWLFGSLLFFGSLVIQDQLHIEERTNIIR